MALLILNWKVDCLNDLPITSDVEETEDDPINYNTEFNCVLERQVHSLFLPKLMTSKKILYSIYCNVCLNISYSD